MKTISIELTEKEVEHLEIMLSTDINESAITIRQMDLYPTENKSVDNSSKEWIVNWIRRSEEIKNKLKRS